MGGLTRPVLHTTGDRMAARRKLDRRRDDLCAVEFRKRHRACQRLAAAIG
jgi:hypothetical protein